MPVIVNASGPVDILAMVPPMVGFLPRNSVVFLCFRGKRTCGAMRFDLPAPASRAIQKRFVSTFVGTLCKLPRLDAVVTVIYTDDGFAGGSAVPHADFAEVLGRRIDQSGIGLRDSICQASDGWASYLEPRVPAGGHPLDEIADSGAAAAIPDELRPLAGSDDIPCRVPDAEPSAMVRMKKRLAMYGRLTESRVKSRVANLNGVSGGEPRFAADSLRDISLFVDAALGWNAAATQRNGALLAFVLQEPSVRDLVMLQWATSFEVGRQAWDEVLAARSIPHPGSDDRIADGDRVADRSQPVNFADIMMGVGPRPDPAQVEAGIALVLTLVAQLADKDRPPLLCMLVWLNWALGRGSMAGRHLDEVLAIDPSYSMAQLLGTMLGNGMLPEWAFAES